MSQAPAPKAEPEATSTPTPATQTPTTSYTPGSWAAGRKFVYIGTVLLTSLISSEIPIDPVLQQQSANAT